MHLKETVLKRLSVKPMKSLIKNIVGLLLILSQISCGKDSDEPKSSGNYLKVENIEYDLSGGIFLNFGTQDHNSWSFNGYNIDLTLYSDGITLQTDEDGLPNLVGIGHGIFFEMFSSTGTGLDAREYYFSSTVPCLIGTFDSGRYAVNADAEFNPEIDTGDTVEHSQFLNGRVSVTRNGDEYQFSIDCLAENGKRITGYYSGSLQYFDMSACCHKSAP